MPEKKLAGLNVVLFESRHAKTLADLVSLQGGRPVAAPSLKEVPVEKNEDAFRFGEELLAGRVDMVLFLTGVGTRALFSVLETRHPKEKIFDSLKKITVVPRGPKPVRALNEFGIPYAFTVPEPNTWREVLAAIDARPDTCPLRGRQVAVQEYGVTNRELLEGLSDRGAKVLRVPVYRWELPDDLEPLKSAIRGIVEGRSDVAVFTTSVQIEHAMKVADSLGLAERFVNALGNTVVASVGPDCSAALRAYGIEPDIEPVSPKMGPLIEQTAARAAGLLERKRHCAVEVREAMLETALRDEAQQSVFMKACRREATPYTPVWLMRQAGRYQKEYRAIREKTPFLELCKNAELASEVTVNAQESLGVDAAILFSDILLIIEPLGFRLTYAKGDGPSIGDPVDSAERVRRIPDADVVSDLSYVLDAVRKIRRRLRADVPLIGFAGAPFTLASYLIEGGGSREFVKTRRFMREEPDAWHLLMEKLSVATLAYLKSQARAGAQALQLFDSWVGALNEIEYERFVLPYSLRIFEGLRGVPTIHFGVGTAHLLPLLKRAGGDVIGIDHRIRLDEAWKKVGYDRAVQGNLDPAVLCGDTKTLRAYVERILAEAGGRPGHIFNLGHGVLPETPPENAAALVQMVHSLSQKNHVR